MKFLDPLYAIRRFESGHDYNALVGEAVGKGTADKYVQDAYGFPQWPGRKFSTGISHAAGAYQFQPTTWALYAAPLGIADFSPKSQDAVAAACYASRAFADWAPYDTKLANFIKMSGGAGVFSLGASWLARP